MVYKPIGKKSPIKSFRKRRAIRRLRKRLVKSSMVRGRAELALGQKSQQYATITETILFPDIPVNTFTYETFSLKDFVRALQIAPNFKYYRAKKVIYKYEPLFETFTDGGAESLPYMYSIMNRTQERRSYNAAQLRMMGAVPTVFKSTKIEKYVPNWCAQGLGAYTQAPGGPITSINAQGLRKCYDWLNSPQYPGALDASSPLINGALTAGNVNPMATYNAQTIYNGHCVFFDQAITGGSPIVCRRTVTVVWEFKGPKTDIDIVPIYPPNNTEDLSNNVVLQV